MTMKKVNPRNVPKSQADVDRAFRDVMRLGQEYATAIYLTVLYDKEHADQDIMQRVGQEINDLADSLIKGYVTLADLKNTLKKEYGVEV